MALHNAIILHVRQDQRDLQGHGNVLPLVFNA